MSYSDYLRSDRWRQNKAAWKGSPKAKRGRCFCCGATDKPLDMHHLTYRNLGSERPHQLKQLCRDCHQAVHDLVKQTGKGIYTATWAYRKQLLGR